MSSSAQDNLLADAIARNAGLVISLPSAGMLRHHKSRFLGETPEGFWVESAPGENPLIDDLIAKQQNTGLSFKAGAQKVVFAARILKYDPQFRVNAETIVEALLIAHPKEVKAVQRRNNYRVRVPLDCGLRIRLWRIGEQVDLRDRPMAAQELSLHVKDVSIGGMGVTFMPKDGQAARLTSEDRLRIEFEYKEVLLLMEGRMKHPSLIASTTPTPAGVQFKALENNLEGRQALAAITKIVGELQRDEVRRLRLGAIGSA